ncbi:MAG TPA: CopG family transcriptional regulator [Candidatus Brocadiia bacterium]|nr:CopG family transcriptional regulator [Candidatus Brocadiia bacterium]
MKKKLKASGRKQDIVTFKVDQSLMDAMKGIPNRSRFIRAAILSALNNTCPVCNGTGTLTPDQRAMLDEIKGKPVLKRCEECKALRLMSGGSQGDAVH